MRPSSILNFDRFFLTSVALGLVNSIISYNDSLAMLKADPATAQAGFGIGFIVTITVFALGIPLLLWFLISRRASNVAKWILVVMTVLGFIMMIPTLPLLMNRGGVSLAIMAIVAILQLAAISFLFRSDAKAWLGSGGKSDGDTPGIFE